MDLKDLNNFSDFLGEILNQMLEDGQQPPFHCVSVGVNGSFLACTFRVPKPGDDPLLTGFECDFKAEAIDPRGFQVPINIMLVARDGRATHVAIAKADSLPLITHIVQ